MITPRYDLSLDFLRRHRAEGPWTLTCIDPDKKGIETRTFRPGTTKDLMDWLALHGQSRNIYYSVNEPLTDISKKADREDIKSLSWLHVDLDPRAGEDPAQERERILKVLRNPPSGLPPPTFIIFSGGGYNALWKLKEPVPVNGDMASAEDAKRWNLQIELLLSADNCHNIDRILRLPGTINRPDPRKRKKGRVDALAEVVDHDETRVYPIEKFTKAPQTQSGMTTGFSSNTVKVSGNLKRLSSVDDLPDGVSNRAKVVIVQGLDPDDANKFPSRSEWLFYACCEMVRGGCSDDIIFSVITDPSFGIATSVLDKGSNFEKYALRQIERAKEEAVDPDLRRLNERFAVIGNWGGKCRVVEEIFDDAMKRYRVTKQSFEDFRNRFMSQHKEVGDGPTGPQMKPMGHWWLSHPKRRQYDSLVFSPGRETPNAYNLWRGFACDAKPGDCGLFLRHLNDNICRGDKILFDYLLGWMARSVQQPDSPGYSAIVLRGGQGTGKSFVAKTLGSLFGRHYMQVTDPKHLVGSFNAHLRDCVVLFGDEAFYAGDKKHESILKMLITEELITIEAKGVDAEASANCVHLLMASNDQWVVPAGFDDRRFFVLDVSDSQKNSHEYFKAVQDQLDHGGREALLHMLLTHDLSGFNVRNVPKTAALQQQKIYSFSVEEEWWFTKLRQGRIRETDNGWRCDICTMDLTTDFIEYCRSFGMSRRGNATRLGYSLGRFVPNLGPTEQRRTAVEVDMPDGSRKTIARPYFYIFPPLDECRKAWDKNFGGPYDWPAASAVEEQGELGTKEIPF